MTPDRRLDQLEPLLAEHSAQLDLHTAQLRRITAGIQIVTEAVGQQSDNITFLLQEVAGVKQQQAQTKADIEQIKQEQAGMKADIGEMKADIEQIKQEQGRQTQTLTAILNILQGRSDN